MDDAPSTSYRTRADYKRVVVTVIRNTDSRRLTQDVTYVAPPGGGTVAGQNEGIVLAQVIDSALNTPVVGASVTLSGGPTSARTDTTDTSGSVVFPALLPTNASLNHYDVTATMTGYATMREDTPPSSAAHTTIVGGQTFQTILRVYKPSSISVVPRNADGSAYTGQATVTISSTRGTESFPVSFSGTPFTITASQTLANEPIVPNVQYTVQVFAATGATTPATAQLVPAAYPTDLTRTFVVTLAPLVAPQTLTVKVTNAGGANVGGATVTVSGGPGGYVLLTGTSNASGTVVFTVPSNSSPGYTITAKSGTLTGTATTAVTGATPKTVTVK
jgi:hypothetical protein